MVHAYLSGSESENATQSASKLLQYEINSAYAENNDLSVQSALQVTQSKVQEVYADVNISLRDIVLYGCFYQKGTSKQTTEKGYYHLTCTQMIDGVPFAASIHRAYCEGGSVEDLVLERIGTVDGYVIDENSYCIDCNLWNVVNRVECDNEWISFDAVLPQVEEKILSGNIRNVYHVQFGYVQYDIGRNEQEQYALVPSWVVWVDWLSNASDEIATDTENETAFFTETYTYLPLIINAVTGEMSDPANMDSQRMIVQAPFSDYISNLNFAE